MASKLFGATLFQTTGNPANERYNVLGKTSEVIAVNDILTVASGVAKVVAAATDPIYGVAQKAATMGATNTTVYPAVIPATDGNIFLMGCNSALTDNKTDYGKFFGITGATGAQQVNVSGGATTTTSRQVVILEVDPLQLGGTEGPQEVLVQFVSVTAAPTVN